MNSAFAQQKTALSGTIIYEAKQAH